MPRYEPIIPGIIMALLETRHLEIIQEVGVDEVQSFWLENVFYKKTFLAIWWGGAEKGLVFTFYLFFSSVCFIVHLSHYHYK